MENMDGYVRLSIKQKKRNHRPSLMDGEESECTDDATENARDRFEGRLSVDSFELVTVQKTPVRNCKLKVLVTLCGSGIIIGLALILHFYTNHATVFSIGDKSVGTAELNLSEKNLKILDGDGNVKLTIMLAGENNHTLSSNYKKCSNFPVELCVVWPSDGTTLQVSHFIPKLTGTISPKQTQCYKVSWLYQDNQSIEDCVFLDNVLNKKKSHHQIWFDTTRYLLWPRQQREICTSSCHSLITGWNDTTRRQVLKYKRLGPSIVEPLWVSSEAISIKASMQYPLVVCENLCQNATRSTLCFKTHTGTVGNHIKIPSFSSLSYTVCSSASAVPHPTKEMVNLLNLGQTDSQDEFVDDNDKQILEKITQSASVSSKKTSFLKCNTLFTKPLWNIEFNGKEYDAASIERELLDIQEIGGTATFHNLTKIFTNVGDYHLRNDSVINFPYLLHSIRNMGFKIMLPVSPFVNYDSANFHHALNQNFLVRNRYGAPVLSNLAILGKNIYSGIIDFTNPQAIKWFASITANFKQESIIDYLHLYYGHEVWLPDQYLLKNPLINPNFYSTLYVNAAHLIDSCPVTDVAFSSHSDNQVVLLNAATDLESTLKVALAAGIAGYPYFIPNLPFRLAEASMLGPKILEDGFIRWIQLVSFFPVMHMPWDYHYLSKIGVNITSLVSMVKKCMAIRQGELVGQAFAAAFDAAGGVWPQPIVAPVWMAGDIPLDSTSGYSSEMVFQIQDQFMIGKDLLVAPVLQMGHVERTVYFPPGKWMNVLKSEEDRIVSNGKVWVKHYQASLNDILVFIRQPVGSTPSIA